MCSRDGLKLNSVLCYHTVCNYILGNESLHFLTKIIDHKLASQYLHGALEVLIRYNQAQ